MILCVCFKKIKMERSRLKHNAYVNPAPLFEFTYPNNQCTKYGMTNEKIYTYTYTEKYKYYTRFIYTFTYNRIYLYIPFHRIHRIKTHYFAFELYKYK